MPEVDRRVRTGGFAATYRLPCASERPAAEAAEFLGSDCLARTARDLETLRRWEQARRGSGVEAFHWERWVRREYERFGPLLERLV
jgi:hypothetical protein